MYKGIMTHEEILIKVTEHDSRLDVAEKRLDKMEAAQKEITELNSLFSELSVTVKSLTSSMDNLNTRMRAAELAPGEKFEKLKWIIVTALCTATIGGLVAAVIAAI